jgi:hypothetical protein
MMTCFELFRGMLQCFSPSEKRQAKNAKQKTEEPSITLSFQQADDA